MAADGSDLKTLETWQTVRAFALALPEAEEEFPWGETVAKVRKKVFVFLGVDDGSHPLGITVKLKDEETHAHALTVVGARACRIRPRQGGLVVHSPGGAAPSAELLCEWVEDSYRTIAPKKLTAELDTRMARESPGHTSP